MKYIQIIAASVIWGSAYPFTKYLVGEVSPLTAVTLRTSIGALVLLAASGVRFEPAGPRPRFFRKIFALSLLGVSVQQYVQAYALRFTSAGHAGWLIVTIPIMVAAAMALLGERLGRYKAAALALGSAGALLVVFSGAPGPAGTAAAAMRADMIFLISCLNWTGYVVLSRKWFSARSQAEITSATMFTAMLTLLAVWVVSGGAADLASLSFKGWLCAAYLGALSSALAYTFWNNSVERLGPVTASYFIYLQPFAAALSAYIFIGERPAPWAFAGGGLIMAGVYFVNLNGERR